MRVLKGVFVLGCLVFTVVAVGWVVAGPPANPDAVGNSNVVGAFVGVAALIVAIAALGGRGGESRATALSAEQEEQVVDRLAREMWWIWREQAHLRGVRRGVASVSVRWKWADESVAAPPTDFQPFAPDLATAGVVAAMKSTLYDALPGETRLVILGEPGAGKTGAAVVLLLDVLAARRADRDEPVPVLLSLGGWNPRTPLLEWAAATIARDYRTAVPGVTGVQVAAELLRRERIALFLDGLDELPADRRGPALRAIDSQAVGLRIVLTSRRKEYAAALATDQLSAAAVVTLRPPDPASIEEYLVTGLVGRRRRQWRAVADHLRRDPDTVVAAVLGTPLALDLARQTYARNGDPTELIAPDRYPSPAALLDHVIARFLDQAYPDPRDHDRALYWLVWIARRMGEQRDLAWWRIPAWLPRWAYGIVYGLVAAVGAGVCTAIASVAMFGIGTAGDVAAAATDGWVVGLVVGLATGVVVAYEGEITGGRPDDHERGRRSRLAATGPVALTPRRLRLRDLPAVWDGVVVAAQRGAAAAAALSVAAVAVFLTVDFGESFWVRVGYGLGVGLVSLLFAVTVGVVAHVVVDLWGRPLTDADVMAPSRGYASDRTVHALYACVSLVVGAALVTVVVRVLDPDSFLAWMVLLPGLAGGLLVGLGARLALGAVPAVKVAELLLWVRYGRRVRFQRLLKEALDRQVLRQAGAVYQFRHAAIQDHLARRDDTSAGDEVRWPAWLRPAILRLRLGVTHARGRIPTAAFRPAVLALVGGGLAVVIVAVTVSVRDEPLLALPKFEDTVTALAVAPGGATMAVGSDDDKIRILATDTGTVIRTLAGHTDDVTSVAFAPDGATLASSGADDTLRLWDLATGAVRHRMSREDSGLGGPQVGFSRDGAVVAATDDKKVRAWDVATGRRVRTVATSDARFLRIAFAAGDALFTLDEHHQVEAWRVATGRSVRRPASGVWIIATSADGAVVAAGGEGRVQLFDAVTGNPITALDRPGTPYALAWAPDGRTLAVGYAEGTWGASRTAWIWDVGSGQPPRRVPERGSAPSAIAFLPDGKTLVGAVDQRIVLWRVDTGQVVRTICLADSHRVNPRYTGCSP